MEVAASSVEGAASESGIELVAAGSVEEVGPSPIVVLPASPELGPGFVPCSVVVLEPDSGVLAVLAVTVSTAPEEVAPSVPLVELSEVGVPEDDSGREGRVTSSNSLFSNLDDDSVMEAEAEKAVSMAEDVSAIPLCIANEVR